MAIVHYAMQIEQLSDIKALVMRLKSDTVPGSKTQSWLRLCRKIKDNPRFITAPFRETKAFEKLYNQRDRKSTRLNSSHYQQSRMPSSA